MNYLDRIKESVELQMALSELLNVELKIVECWHENDKPIWQCKKCNWVASGISVENNNPNLFIPESFLTVWDVVKDRDWFERFLHVYVDVVRRNNENGLKIIASPHFQLEVLKWLNPEGLAKIMEETFQSALSKTLNDVIKEGEGE